MKARFETVWYAQALLRELVLIYPTAAIMMQEQGVSAVSLALLFIIWSASAVIFEVPTGVLADRMSRHRLLVTAGLVKGCAFVVWWLAPAFWGFALGFVIWGLGSALRSGTSEAYLHDTLTGQGRAEAFERVYGREQAASTCGVATALVLGGWVAESGYTLPLLLSALAPWSSALLVALGLAEPVRTVLAQPERFTDTLVAGMREMRVVRGVLAAVVMIALLPTVYDVFEEFVPPLLDELGYSLTGVGLAYGAAFLVRALSVVWAHRWRSLGLDSLCWLFLAAGLLLGLGMFTGGHLPALALCAFFALSGIGSVLLQGRLQAAIEGHARATITSVAGVLQEVSSLGIYLAIGVVAQWFDWRLAAVATGLWLVLTALAIRWHLSRGLPRLRAEQA